MLLNCPHCHTSHSITFKQIYWVICENCNHALIYENDKLTTHTKLTGQHANNTYTLKIGGTGRLKGQPFEVLGHIHQVLVSGEDEWNDWFLGFKDGTMGTLLIDQSQNYFYYAIKQKVRGAVQNWKDVSVDTQVQIDQYPVDVYEVGQIKSAMFSGKIPHYSPPHSTIGYFEGYFRDYITCVEYHASGPTIHFGTQLESHLIEFDA